MFWFCGREILVPQPGTEPTPPALEGKILTIEPQGSPPISSSFIF